MKFHRDGTQPTNPTDVFVFGSNLSGVHGAGAARAALNQFGAEWGVAEGLIGRSYAIPTKGKIEDDLPTLPESVIAQYVATFIAFTHQNDHLSFFITRVGCGLAGLEDSVIAPMFRGVGDNCSIAHEWKQWLD